MKSLFTQSLVSIIKRVSAVASTVFMLVMLAACSSSGGGDSVTKTQVVAVTDVTLNTGDFELQLNNNNTPAATYPLKATVLPSNATDKTVEYSSDKTEIATVDKTSGLVTAVAVGTANITAMSVSDNTKKRTVKVKVQPATATPVAVTNVALNKSSTTLVVNATETLVATVTPSTASNPNVAWSSDNTAVATVDGGVVTAKSVGSATITVKSVADNSKTATATVNVVAATKAVSGITLNKATTSIIVGKTETLVATITPSDATNQNVSWKSSDEGVATVVGGVVTAKSAGTAKITVTTEDGNKEASTDVTVIRYSLVAKSGGTYDKTECVKDNITGLIWEGKTADGGTRDKDKTYTNYDDANSAQFNASGSYRNPTPTEINASTNSIGYRNTVNALSLCGFTDWRMPTSDELKGLVQGTTGPTIDTTWFPNTASNWYWSASPYAAYSVFALDVSFDYGDVSVSVRNYADRVRLVRGSQ